jgi:hypothetical protein
MRRQVGMCWLGLNKYACALRAQLPIPPWADPELVTGHAAQPAPSEPVAVSRSEWGCWPGVVWVAPGRPTQLLSHLACRPTRPQIRPNLSRLW